MDKLHVVRSYVEFYMPLYTFLDTMLVNSPIWFRRSKSGGKESFVWLLAEKEKSNVQFKIYFSASQLPNLLKYAK